MWSLIIITRKLLRSRWSVSCNYRWLLVWKFCHDMTLLPQLCTIIRSAPCLWFSFSGSILRSISSKSSWYRSCWLWASSKEVIRAATIVAWNRSFVLIGIFRTLRPCSVGVHEEEERVFALTEYESCVPKFQIPEFKKPVSKLLKVSSFMSCDKHQRPRWCEAARSKC